MVGAWIIGQYQGNGQGMDNGRAWIMDQGQDNDWGMDNEARAMVRAWIIGQYQGNGWGMDNRLVPGQWLGHG